MLSIRDLNITFLQYERGLRRRVTHPVDHLNLNIDSGELVAVVGASGSGKSLLAHAVLGILPYNATVSGSIRYGGEELTKERAAGLRGKEICLVPQGVSWLDPLMRVGNQLENGRKEPGRREPGRREKSLEALKSCGLEETVAERYPHQLSGGMARRVLLATAVMEHPRLVIADEPTPGLPPHRARSVMERLRKMAEDGAAVMLITHDVELALAFCHRIAVMHDGTVVEEAAAEEFADWQRLRHPYARQLSRALPQNDFFGGEGR